MKSTAESINTAELATMAKVHTAARQRRLLLAAGGGLLASSFFARPGLFAEELSAATPRLTEGPFYPDTLPLDQDNDLIRVDDRITPAVGIVTHLTGRVLSRTGSPLRGVTVEIWQCDANGVYLHSKDSGRKPGRRDENFQGYGKFETASDGGYRFRTIKPVQYSGRPAPHIHLKLSRGGRELLTTQLLVRGELGNARDGVFKRIREPAKRELLLGDWTRVPDSTTGDMACQFDLILGRTPDDADS